MAELEGVSQFFDREFLAEEDEYGELYSVWPASSELVRLMTSEHERFGRWVAAGMPPYHGAPALESEREAAVEERTAIENIRAALGEPKKLRLSFTAPTEKSAGYEGWWVSLLP